MNISRRRLLETMPLASAAACFALVGCATSTVDGVTTVTINLATADAYAEAIENGTNMLLAIPLITTAMGAATVTIVKAAVTAATTAIGQLNATYKGKISFTFTVGSAPAALNALVTNANTINGAVSTVVASLGTQISAADQQIIEAIQTIVAVLTSLVSGAVGAPLKENVGQALKVLGVKAA